MSEDKKKAKKEVKDKDKEKDKDSKEKKKKDGSKTEKTKKTVKKKEGKDKEKKEKVAKTPKKETKDKEKDEKKDKDGAEKKTTKKRSPAQILKKEYNKWLDIAEETANLDWKSVNEAENLVVMAFGKCEFNVTYPATYPECDVNFFVFSTSDGMDKWNDEMQDVCDRKRQITFTEILNKCAELFLDCGPELEDSDEDDAGVAVDGYDFGDDIDKATVTITTDKKTSQVDSEFANRKFLEIGSPAATMRLISDLKSLKRSEGGGGTESLGFLAKPKIDPGKHLENLYHWEVKLSGFTGEIGEDLKRYAQGYVELEMRFSKDYPFQPPFVRVVQPRFKFMTGHVTTGGSICMELLTNTGWRSTNDIESILIQIRAEMQEGGARLESGGGSYSESEAWDAFYRAAKNHGWDVKGLDKNMFPKV